MGFRLISHEVNSAVGDSGYKCHKLCHDTDLPRDVMIQIKSSCFQMGKADQGYYSCLEVVLMRDSVWSFLDDWRQQIKVMVIKMCYFSLFSNKSDGDINGNEPNRRQDPPWLLALPLPPWLTTLLLLFVVFTLTDGACWEPIWHQAWNSMTENNFLDLT